MSERLHKHICAIIWRDQKTTVRGSGIMISRDLVLTTANSIYYKKSRVDMRLI